MSLSKNFQVIFEYVFKKKRLYVNSNLWNDNDLDPPMALWTIKKKTGNNQCRCCVLIALQKRGYHGIISIFGKRSGYDTVFGSFGTQEDIQRCGGDAESRDRERPVYWTKRLKNIVDSRGGRCHPAAAHRPSLAL